MARPKSGYVNAAGEKLPGVTTVLNRFKDSGGLIYWAWTQGRDGRDFRETSQAAADAGTIAHAMIEAHLRGKSAEETQAAFNAAEEVNDKAINGFLAFLDFQKRTNFVVEETELSLVSERYGFAGTMDCSVFLIDGKRSLGDFKTGKRIYTDSLVQVAGGYRLLWEENRPHKPVTGGYDLFNVKQESGDFSWHHFDNVPEAKDYFLLLLQAYKLDKILSKRVG
jgi:hypothetical protein